jgi:hypothetical protein
MKGHYLPEVYLKQFQNLSKKLWKYKVNSMLPRKPNLISAAQVCYGHDFYKIDFVETLKAHDIDNPLFLEKKGLKQYEDRYETIISKILKREESIITKHARFFLKGLLLIKLRNNHIRTTLLNSGALKESVERTIERLKGSIEKLEQETGLKLMEPLEKRKEEFLLDERSPKDMHLRILLDDASGENKLTEEIINFMMETHWFIFRATPPNAFIFSDNPGFCITDDEKLQNLKFTGIFTFCFPLTPSYTLIIMSGFKDEDANESHKSINYRFADASLVAMINRGTIANCNRDIFSAEEETLEKVMGDFKAVTRVK